MPLLYESGQLAESDVRPILVATTHERVVRLLERVFTLPERLKMVHERERICPVAVVR